MVEVPQNTQYVGSADSRRIGFTESNKPAEYQPTLEQRQVSEAVQTGGEEFFSADTEARKSAGEQLKKLHGKELVNAGFKQIGIGAWETIKSEIVTGLRGMVIGGAVGGVFGFATQRPESGLAAGLGLGGIVGAVTGYETAGAKYNKKVVPEKNLPKTEWYDWVTGNLSFLAYDTLMPRLVSKVQPRFPGAGLVTWAGLVAGEMFMNPISMAGARNVATGLLTMGKG